MVKMIAIMYDIDDDANNNYYMILLMMMQINDNDECS